MGFELNIHWRGPDISDMIRNAKEGNKGTLQIGYPEASEQGYIASLHEFGCQQQTTLKQIIFLSNNEGKKGGSRKKRSKQSHGWKHVPLTITLPARPFVGPSFEKYHPIALQQIKNKVPGLLTGTFSGPLLLEAAGKVLMGKMKRYVTAEEGNWKSLHPITVLWKKSNKKLVNTGQMVRRLDYKVEG